MADPKQDAHRWARLLALTTLAGILCGLIGPYGSFIANPISRICFWVSVFWAGTLILWPSVMGALRFAEQQGLPILFAMIGAMLAGCLPLAVFAWASCSLFWPVHASGIRPQEWYVLTVILAAPATALALWLEHFRYRDHRAHWVSGGEVRPVAENGGVPDRLLDLIGLPADGGPSCPGLYGGGLQPPFRGDARRGDPIGRARVAGAPLLVGRA